MFYLCSFKSFFKVPIKNIIKTPCSTVQQHAQTLTVAILCTGLKAVDYCKSGCGVLE